MAHQAMRKAILNKIAHSDYVPPVFFYLSLSDWQTVLHEPVTAEEQPTGEARAELAELREAYWMQGTEFMEFGIFLASARRLKGMPKALLKSIKSCLASEDILRPLLGKVDARVVDGAKKIQGGFAIFLGAVWELVLDFDTAKLLAWLVDLLDPLVKVGCEGFIAGYVYCVRPLDGLMRERKCSGRTKSNQWTRSPLEVPPETTTKLSSELVFLTNLSQVQHPDSPAESLEKNPPAPVSPQPDADDESNDPPTPSRPPSPVWSGIQNELPPLPGSALSIEQLGQLVSELTLAEAIPQVPAPTMDKLMADLFRLLEWDSTPEPPSDVHCTGCLCWAASYARHLPEVLLLIDWSGGSWADAGSSGPADSVGEQFSDGSPQPTVEIPPGPADNTGEGRSDRSSQPAVETPLALSPRRFMLIDGREDLNAQPMISATGGGAVTNAIAVEAASDTQISVAGGGAITDATAVEAASDTQISAAGGGAITGPNAVQAASPAAAENGTAGSTNSLLPAAEISVNVPAVTAAHTAADGRAVATLSSPKGSSPAGSSGASGSPTGRRRSPLTPRNAADGASPHYLQKRRRMRLLSSFPHSWW
ncbi:hypothetical protein FB451DRAFT_1548335 [Mycena latifolia]|nr:hypothetical protein FB451DRAFT_1548335 [Mycena latifolia]